MTQQIINIGSAPNDGTGDQLRSSFDKCNLNFTELYQGVAKGVSIGAAIEYQFNNTTTEPPASGQIRFNQATQASTTKLWASHTTSSGINIKQFLSAATTGAKLILQDENDNTNYIKFDVTGVPIDKTTYWEFAVAVTASGGNLPNAAILAAVTAAAGSAGAPVGAEYITSTTDATLTAERVLTDTATVTWDRTTPGQIKATSAGGIGTGRLEYVSATALKFAPFNGNQIKINGALFTIPTAGIAGLANTGVFVNGTGGSSLAASTVYWVFAFSNSGVVTADFRTAATHATSTTAGNEGVEVLTSNDSRSLIGLCRTNASSQFVDTAAQRFVRSWFNLQALPLQAANPVIYAGATAATWTELVANTRVEWINWLNETIHLSFEGTCANGVAGNWVNNGIGVDSTTTSTAPETLTFTITAGFRSNFATSCDVNPAEGYHFAAALSAAVPGGSNWYASNNPGPGPFLHGNIMH